MKVRSSELRVLYVLVPLLMLLQVGTFLLLRVANRDIVEQTLRNELGAGSQVFQRLIEQHSQHLRQATDLVAKDYGFREAVTSGHRDTVDSMLSNHRERMGAGLVVLTALSGEVMGQSVSAEVGPDGPAPPVSDALMAGQVRHVTPGRIQMFPLYTHQHALYQWVKTVVRSPMPSAHLSFGFEIDRAMAKDLAEMTDLEFVFLSRQGTQGWQLHAASFDTGLQQAVLRQADKLDNTHWRLKTEHSDHSMLTVEMGSDGRSRVIAVIGKPVQRVMAPFLQLEQAVGFLILVSAALSVLAVVRVTRSVVAPLDEVVYVDNLTGLANRRLFELNLRLAAQNLRTLKRGYSLMVMDLNKFKAVNDTLGHAAGDQVLKEAARRIQGAIRNSDTIARLGGDEFALLLITDDRQKAAAIARQIVARVCQPIALDNSPQPTVEVGVSIGIAMAPQDGSVPEELLHCADEAMYAAKLNRSGFAFCKVEPAPSEMPPAAQPQPQPPR